METDELAQKVREIAQEVYEELGGGFDESIYRDAMMIELKEEGILCVRERNIDLYYKEHLLGQGRIDLLVGEEEKIIVELKTKGVLSARDKNQLRTYLNSSRLDSSIPDVSCGVLINFQRFDEEQIEYDFEDECEEPEIVRMEE